MTALGRNKQENQKATQEQTQSSTPFQWEGGAPPGEKIHFQSKSEFALKMIVSFSLPLCFYFGFLFINPNRGQLFLLVSPINSIPGIHYKTFLKGSRHPSDLFHNAWQGFRNICEALSTDHAWATLGAKLLLEVARLGWAGWLRGSPGWAGCVAWAAWLPGLAGYLGCLARWCLAGKLPRLAGWAGGLGWPAVCGGWLAGVGWLAPWPAGWLPRLPPWLSSCPAGWCLARWLAGLAA